MSKPSPRISPPSYAFLYVPIVVLIVLSFNKAGLPTVWTDSRSNGTASLRPTRRSSHPAGTRLSSQRFSTIIATAIGTLLALGVERSRPVRLARCAAVRADDHSGHRAGDRTPLLLHAAEILAGLQSIIVAHVVFNLAFVCAVVRARLKSYDWSLNEASRDLGATAFTTFWRITLPLILPRSSRRHCSPSRCRSTNSSSPISRLVPGNPPRRCRCRSTP
jgi:spermidine/putrescine transport system permease protein